MASRRRGHIEVMTGGSIVFLVVVVLIVVVLVLGFYTRRGSAINQRPRGATRSEDPGVGAGPSRISSAEDETEGKITSHGTGGSRTS